MVPTRCMSVPKGRGEPGPRYGLGGTRPTVTDAHLVSVTFIDVRFNDGRMQPDAAAAKRVIEEHMKRGSARPRRRDRRARNFATANAAMANAVCAVPTERGWTRVTSR